ncbi:MAG: hypothetical protein ACRD3W_05315, partial [Terriglobales bacterium]
SPCFSQELQLRTVGDNRSQLRSGTCSILNNDDTDRAIHKAAHTCKALEQTGIPDSDLNYQSIFRQTLVSDKRL